VFLKNVQPSKAGRLSLHIVTWNVGLHAIDDLLNATNRCGDFQHSGGFSSDDRTQKRDTPLFNNHFDVRMRRHSSNLRSNVIRKDVIADVCVLQRSRSDGDESFQPMRGIPRRNVDSPANYPHTVDYSIPCERAAALAELCVCHIRQSGA
jgi:hypothetical protein